MSHQLLSGHQGTMSGRAFQRAVHSVREGYSSLLVPYLGRPHHTVSRRLGRRESGIRVSFASHNICRFSRSLLNGGILNDLSNFSLLKPFMTTVQLTLRTKQIILRKHTCSLLISSFVRLQDSIFHRSMFAGIARKNILLALQETVGT